jgi:iron-regulated transporter 1
MTESTAAEAAARKKKKDSDIRTPLVDRDALSDQERQSLFAVDEAGQQRQRQQHGQGARFSFVKRGVLSFRDYSHHIVFLASLAYAIIYINMMRFVNQSSPLHFQAVVSTRPIDPIYILSTQGSQGRIPPLFFLIYNSVSGTMIGYLQYRNFSAGSIATLKGICTVSELFGTILMPVLTRYVGLTRAGAWSIWLEVLTLTPVLFSIYSNQLPVQIFIFGRWKKAT